MNTISITMGKHHRPIILSLVVVVLSFAASCVLNDMIPICHYLFGCDHLLHTLG